jgi:hypothetical protein
MYVEPSPCERAHEPTKKGADNAQDVVSTTFRRLCAWFTWQRKNRGTRTPYSLHVWRLVLGCVNPAPRFTINAVTVYARSYTCNGEKRLTTYLFLCDEFVVRVVF